MKLIRVIYELFESDYAFIQGNENGDIHEIDREVCLVTYEGKLYVSWSSEPYQYCIGYKQSSWYTNEPAVVIDASSWFMWAPLINNEFSLSFIDPSHIFLELNSSNGKLYFSAQEKGLYGIDVCHISTRYPEVHI